MISLFKYLYNFTPLKKLLSKIKELIYIFPKQCYDKPEGEFIL